MKCDKCGKVLTACDEDSGYAFCKTEVCLNSSGVDLVELGEKAEARAEKAEALNKKIWEVFSDICDHAEGKYGKICLKCTYEACPIVAKAKEGK